MKLMYSTYLSFACLRPIDTVEHVELLYGRQSLGLFSDGTGMSLTTITVVLLTYAHAHSYT